MLSYVMLLIEQMYGGMIVAEMCHYKKRINGQRTSHSSLVRANDDCYIRKLENALEGD